MTTSLPSTTTETATGLSSAGSSQVLDSDLAALLAAASTAPATPGCATPLNFGAMLSGGEGAAAQATNPSAPRAATVMPTADALSTTVAGIAPRATGVRIVATSPRASASPASATRAGEMPDRATVESALALVLPLLGLQSQTAEPGVDLLAAPQETAPGLGDEAADGGEAFIGAESAAPQAQISIMVSGRPVRECSFTLAAPTGSPAAQPQPMLESAGAAPTNSASDASSANAAMLAQTVLNSSPIAAEALSPVLSVEQASSEAITSESSTASVTTEDTSESSAEAPLLTASVDLGADTEVQLKVPYSSISASVSPSTNLQTRTEKSAALSSRPLKLREALESGQGKNFLSGEGEEVSSDTEPAGITVAEARATMFMPPHVDLPAVSQTVSAPVAALVVQGPAAEREPMPELTAVTIAHRAVDAVNEVVEAQAASKLQPVPSVQLKFRVGSDDLSVRVEYRAGVVRTEFRTDSPELRTAIDQEWSKVVGQASTAAHYLDPVFTTAAGTPAGNTSSFAQSNSQQSAAQQQQQQQSQQQGRAAEVFGTVARTSTYQPRETAAAAAPVVTPSSPNSHRLSAVA